MGGLALVDIILDIIIWIMLLIVVFHLRKKIEVLTERIKTLESTINSMEKVTSAATRIYDPEKLKMALEVRRVEIESRLKKEMEGAIREKEHELEFTKHALALTEKELFAALPTLLKALILLPPPIRESVLNDMKESTLKSFIPQAIKEIYEELDKTKPSDVLESMIKQQST
ncbi:MAG TPA: hypothetical protein ENG51_07770 [Deltaproteobacteria bacterium]|nr:hypothetical protein [Deltaproteobacteria bacterium]